MNHISWQQYFMSIALLAAKRSKDPSTQVGSCIVTQDNRVIGIGWNGMPKCKHWLNNDSLLPWGKDSDNALENKYMYVVHSEPNAILHASESVKGCTMYLTWFPCNECAKTIVQSGISKLVYLHDTSARYRESMKAARIMLDSADVVCEKYSDNKDDIVLKF